MQQIAVIGAGQLGSRHLQGLALLDRPAAVTVLDPSPASLAIAKERFEQIPNSKATARYTTSFDELPRELDAAIVATGADTRRAAIERLLDRSRVRVALLEKVLFQRIDDYAPVGELLDRSGTRAWVNCSQRLWPFFRDLRHRTLGKSDVQLTVSGANWGLGCNAIHNLDLLSFLTGGTEVRMEPALDAGSIPSKRPGFIEFTGSLYAFGLRGNRVLQTSFRDGNAPLAFELQCEDFHAIWRVTEGVMKIAEAGAGWKWQERPCHVPYQSQLTHAELLEMIERGTSVLPGYAESAALHVEMLRTFFGHLGHIADSQKQICAIT